MVEDMLAQRKEEMLEEMLNKVHREIKQEVEMYAQGTNAAMDDFIRLSGCSTSTFLSSLSASLYFLSTSNMRHTKCIATYTSSNLKHFNFFGSFGWKEGLMDLRCKSQHVRTRKTMLRSGSAVFPGTAGKHSASAASGRQTSKEDPQRDNWKTLFESLF